MIENTAFDLAFKITLGNEDTVPSGEVETDNNGAAVRFGINEADYPNDPVFTDDYDDGLARAKEIYLAIWTESHLDLINNAQIAAKIFDLEFNCGDMSGIEVLQKSVNALGGRLSEDGRMGPITAAAANALDPQTLMNKIVQVGLFHYKAIVTAKPQYKNDLPGWTRRLESNTQIQKLTA